jgi:hypothetical protein
MFKRKVAKKTSHHSYDNLIRDLFFILLSLSVSFWIVHIGLLNNVVSIISEARLLAAFVGGFFFTSAFTIAPATLVIAALTHTVPRMTLALWGALGALAGDLTIFFFVRDRFTADIMDLIRGSKSKRFKHFFKTGAFRLLSPVIGALIIASPLPDELGMAMMGMSKTRLALIIPISFVMNFVAIWVIVSVVKVI